MCETMSTEIGNGGEKKRPGRSRWSRGQTVVEYLLMTVMLLALFTGLYGALQKSMRLAFIRAGTMILRAYY